MRSLRWLTVASIGCLLAVDPESLAPAGTTRFAAFAVIVGMGGVLSLLSTSVLTDRRLRSAMVLWASLLTVTAASTAAAVDRWHAVFGSPERGLGLLTWIGFGLAFVLGAGLVERDGTHRAVLLVTRAAASVLVAVAGFALAERAGFDPAGTAWSGARLGAPFAQSTFLAVALVLLGAPAAGVVLDRGQPIPWRLVGTVGLVGGAIALAGTQARGPIVGLGVGLALLATARPGRRTNPRTTRLRAIVPAALCLVATAGVVVALSVIRGWSSFGGRLDEWAVGWRGVRSRPLLGAGPEGYRATFGSLVDADYVRRYGAETITDRAHHALIDTALSSGIPAALLLGSLWLVVVRAGWHLLRSRDSAGSRGASMSMRGLVVGVVAVFTQQLLLFPLAEIDPVLWLLAGVIVASAQRDTVLGRRFRHPAAERPARAPIALALVGVVVVIAAVSSAVSVWFLTTSALGDRAMASAPTFRQISSEQAADRALAHRPQSVRLVFAAAAIHATGPSLRDLDQALELLDIGLADHPHDPALRSAYGRALVERAERSDLSADAGTAVSQLNRFVADAPNQPHLSALLARAQQLSGDLESARRSIDRALDLDPDNHEFQALRDDIEKS